MGDLQLTKAPIMTTGMLIRKPVADVFEAFIDPAITTKYWLTKGGGRLEVGKPLEWAWEMYYISIAVVARVIEPDKRAGSGAPASPGWSGHSHPRAGPPHPAPAAAPQRTAAGPPDSSRGST